MYELFNRSTKKKFEVYAHHALIRKKNDFFFENYTFYLTKEEKRASISRKS